MNYKDIVDSLSPHMIDKLKTAIELGKWENGEKLTPEQMDSAMQAVMLWQAKKQGNSENEPFVIDENGEMFTGKGESHKINQANDKHATDSNIIIKHKA